MTPISFQSYEGLVIDMSKEKDLEVGLLLDFYGELLSETKRETVRLYFDEDLSLAEISENLGITRQGVRDSIEKAKAQLYLYEEKLGLAAKLREIEKILGDVSNRLERLESNLDESVGREIADVIAKIKTITI